MLVGRSVAWTSPLASEALPDGVSECVNERSVQVAVSAPSPWGPGRRRTFAVLTSEHADER